MQSYVLEIVNEDVIKIEPGQTILEASLTAGIPHFHVCGGKAECSTCRIVVHEGAKNLSPPNQAELKLSKRKNFDDNVRLACQTHLLEGYVKIQRIIKDVTDLDIYVYSNTSEIMKSIGEEKELALFFLDIRNFTPFMEKHLPFDVMHIIRRLMLLFSDIIKTNNGKPIEFAGDSLYAAFGFDEKIGSAVRNAVNAGKLIFSELRKLNESYIIKYFEEEIKVGVGLHAGRVIVGEKGIENSPLTVMGFPVNIAARLERATRELNNSFLISDYAYSFLNESSAELKQIKLKGIAEPFNIRLIGEQYELSSES